jgi:dienelactone hydrolase
VSAQSDPWAKAERKPGRIGQIASRMDEEAWFVPGGLAADGKPALLKARMFRPAGTGPFKLAVINHGSPPDGAKRPEMSVPTFRAAAEWLVERGYMVVMPLRRGYGETGPWPEGYGTCKNPNFVAAGRATADDIEAVVRYLRTLPTVRKDRVLVVGQSAGGFGAVALAGRNPDGVFAILNFAGGRGAHQGDDDQNCAPERLVSAMRSFGGGARLPSLWLYTQNDTSFEPALSKRMADAYRAGGGNAQYVLLPAYGRDGHGMFGQANGRVLWTGPVGEFLRTLE